MESSNIDWNGVNTLSTAVYLINRKFQLDPMMSLFDEGALLRLASYIVGKLSDAENFPECMNIYSAGNITNRAIAVSPYGVFGRDFASHAASLVQSALYPEDF